MDGKSGSEVRVYKQRRYFFPEKQFTWFEMIFVELKKKKKAYGETPVNDLGSCK